MLNPVPETPTLEIVTFEFPLFVKVTGNEMLLPVLTLPKLRLVGLAPNKCVALTPVPLREIVSGELGALLRRTTDPLTVPAAAGANTALNVAVLPAAIVSGTVRPVVLKPVPEGVASEIVTLALPPFVKVISCELLPPVTTFPKFTLVGLAESCG